MQATIAQVLLEARDLTVDLPGDEGVSRVLDRVALSVAPGEVVDVTGPSGAGKSTLLRSLARLLPRVDGTLLLDERPADEFSSSEWRSAVALLPQKPAIVTGDVAANLMLPWALKVRHGRPAPDENALRVGLDSLGLSDVSLRRDAARLSVGQQARIALLRVMLTSPRVLLLDEPDAALDAASSAAVAAGVRAFVAGGGAVVRVRHREPDELSARRLRLEAGRLVEESRP